jgi:hypothetical protein
MSKGEFSPQFNWETLEKVRKTEQQILYDSEVQKIEAIVMNHAKDSRSEYANWKFDAKLSTENTLKILTELCARFPGRVWAYDSKTKWIVEPNRIRWGEGFQIDLRLNMK